MSRRRARIRRGPTSRLPSVALRSIAIRTFAPPDSLRAPRASSSPRRTTNLAVSRSVWIELLAIDDAASTRRPNIAPAGNTTEFHRGPPDCASFTFHRQCHRRSPPAWMRKQARYRRWPSSSRLRPIPLPWPSPATASPCGIPDTAEHATISAASLNRAPMQSVSSPEALVGPDSGARRTRAARYRSRRRRALGEQASVQRPDRNRVDGQRLQPLQLRKSRSNAGASRAPRARRRREGRAACPRSLLCTCRSGRART